jgi:hypothetical protein
VEHTRGALKVAVRKPEGKRPLGKPRRRWEDNIEIDVKEIVSGSVDLIALVQDKKKRRTVVLG